MPRDLRDEVGRALLPSRAGACDRGEVGDRVEPRGELGTFANFAGRAPLRAPPLEPQPHRGEVEREDGWLRRRRARDRGEDVETLAWAERAIAVARHQAEPWLALATVHYVVGDWPAAVRTIRTALHRAPGLVKAHEMLGSVLLEAGRMDEAAYRDETVLSLDPGAFMARLDLARACMLAGSWARADALLSIEGDRPDERMARLWTRLRADLWRGSRDADVVIPDGFAPTSPTVRLITILIGVQRTKRFPAADRALVEAAVAQATRMSRFRLLLLQLLTEIHAFVGEDALALATLERAVDAGLHDLFWFERCPLLEPLRAGPVYARMLGEMRDRLDVVNAALDAPL
jgi:eukaryotic-like serine/threonine-protein kinase